MSALERERAARRADTRAALDAVPYPTPWRAERDVVVDAAGAIVALVPGEYAARVAAAIAALVSHGAELLDTADRIETVEDELHMAEMVIDELRAGVHEAEQRAMRAEDRGSAA